VLRRLIFDMFLSESSTIAEPGCGTGINLLLMAEQFPHARFIGCDWAQPSCDILAEMARQTGRSIEGHIFNMLTASGWDGAGIDANTAVVTVHAMEQLGPRWQAFADFLCRRRPSLCLHIEPLLELYDADSAFDDRARRYHSKRNYLTGFYPYVVELVRAGQATLLAARRVRFGGLHHEAYSILAWRPRA
jgi:cyclopropane fatty-acyl-phospholipid synthase-like methyltransferase